MKESAPRPDRTTTVRSRRPIGDGPMGRSDAASVPAYRRLAALPATRRHLDQG
jgi:hypothetical protein